LITTTILVLLGIALIFVIWQMMRSGKAPARTVTAMPTVASGAGADLWTARVGDVISIHGAAEDFSDLDFTVDQRNAYEGASRRWIDLSGEFRGTRVYLEVSRASGVEVMGLLDRKRFTLADINVSEDQLADLDARQDSKAIIQFEGKPWRYESSRELAYFESEGDQPKGVYRWLFAEAGGPRLLCIEKWVGESFDVRLARRLNHQDITVYRSSGPAA
jgi:Domain of unknown function (DUF4178)